MLRQRRQEFDSTGHRPESGYIDQLGGVEPVDFFIPR